MHVPNLSSTISVVVDPCIAASMTSALKRRTSCWSRVSTSVTAGVAAKYFSALAYPPRHAPPIVAEKNIKQAENSDDIWENGTAVRYLARGMALLLAMAGLYAYNDKKVVEKPDRTIKDTPPRTRVRATTRAAGAADASDSRKER